MRLAGLILVVFGLVACDSNRYFEENKSIEGASWDFREPVSFNFDLEDSTAMYNLLVNIRHTEDFRYSNLWLFINYSFPQGTSFTDTVECPLAYPDGKWLGDGLGDMRDARISFRQGVTFPNSGNYQISIQHGMRNDRLEGITDVGLRIERAQ